MTTDERTAVMHRLREHIPDSAIADAFGVSRQRVHALLGPRPAKPVAEKPAKLKLDASAAELLPGAIRSWRAKHKLSQTEAAEYLGVSFATLNRWENGHAVPWLASLLLHYFQLTS